MDLFMKKGIVVFLVILLSVIAGESAFLCFSLYEEFDLPEYGHTTNEKLLIVSEEISSSDDDLSDSTQIDNALKDGGMIRIYTSNEWLDENFPSAYKSYGAGNEEGYFWTRGGYLNYIASRGWILTEVVGTTYYFVSADFVIN